MHKYLNRNGNSGIIAYNTDVDSIDILFRDGSMYTYTYASAGVSVVESMKKQAEYGAGLNGFINKYARKLYATKTRA